MPWVRQGDKHVFLSISRPVLPTVTAPLASGADVKPISTGLISEGSFVQYDGIQPSPQFWATQAAQKNYSPTMTVEIAEKNSTCVAGVVTATNQIQTSGVVLAWIIKQKRELPLSGVYSTSVNGVTVANTAIVQVGQAFVMAKSRDSQVEKLTQQFAELCPPAP